MHHYHAIGTTMTLSLALIAGCTTQDGAATTRGATGDKGDTGSTNAAPPDQRIELGGIHWGRDLNAAKAASKKSSKPVLVLFQEVPGCATCQHFGHFVLRHPLLVEAAETAFEPVLVYNNRQGWDADILTAFNEPPWNNPVMRYVDGDGRDLTPRQSGDYTLGGTARKMVSALEAAGRDVPGYLRALAAESDRRDLKRATFAMFCFWTGEAKLGAIDGVVGVRAAFAQGQEAVEVTYDPAVVKYENLVDSAQSMQCASTVFAHDEAQLAAAKAKVGSRASRFDGEARSAPESDHMHTLRATSYSYLPLTSMQAMKVNAALTARDAKALERWLSPRQIAQHQQVIDALRTDPDRLADLTAPSDPGLLADYAAKLDARLAARP
ncbi:MAG: hypothetical protein GC159_19560 [Phycisphaera sp.]|nr:hypothetical protein [Phycisphaera sp.]